MASSPGTSTLIEPVAAFLADAARTELPDDVLHQAKRLLLHGMTATLGAHDHPATRAIGGWVEAVPSPARSARVLWSGTPTRPEHAVLANATMWFLLLGDETHEETAGHPSGPSAAAAFAAGEGAGASGYDVLRAYTLGVEIELAVLSLVGRGTYARGLTNVGLGAAFGSAAACAALAGLGAGESANALAIAAITACPGIYGQAGSVASALNVGTSAESGFVAAELAGRGLTGPPNILEGPTGLLRAYADVESTAETGARLEDLGERWRLFELHFNPSRGDTYTPAALEGLREIRKRAPSKEAADVVRIRCSVAPDIKTAADERRSRLGNDLSDLQAPSDICYCLAATWVFGRLGIHEWAAERLEDRAVLGLRSRVELAGREIGGPRERLGAVVEVEFADGSRDRQTVERFRGHVRNPLSDSELERDFVEVAEGRISAERARRVIDTIWTLDERTSVLELLDLLVTDEPSAGVPA